MAQHNVGLAFLHHSSGLANPVPCHSALSVVISHGDGLSSRREAPSQSSESSRPKEHDYIGLSEVSSSSSSPSSPSISFANETSDHVTIKETDLHLGLGLGFAMPPARNSDLPKPMEFSSPQQEMKCPCPSEKSNEAFPPSKRGVKRLFSELMMDVGSDGKSSKQNFIGTLPKDQPIAFQAATTCAGGPGFCHVGVDQLMASHRNSVNVGGTIAADASAPPWNSTYKESSKYYMYNNQDEGLAEPPPAKAQVVGWPPVRSYRKNILSAHPKELAGDEEEGQSAIYVKVNMDGNPIGRKVDLNVVGSYEGLVSALEEMFQSPNGMHFLRNSESVLTYEDQEGDWMLVGDVPWSMFINTVRRLRILRGYQAGVAAPLAANFHA